MPTEITALRSVPIVTEPVEARLGERERTDYHDYKTRLLDWLHTVGKDPDHAEGYAEATVRQGSYKTDKVYRWLWGERAFPVDHALLGLVAIEDWDALRRFLRELGFEDVDDLPALSSEEFA